MSNDKFHLGMLVETNRSFWKKQWKKSTELPENGCSVRDTLLYNIGFITCINGGRITLNYKHVFNSEDLKRRGEDE